MLADHNAFHGGDGRSLASRRRQLDSAEACEGRGRGGQVGTKSGPRPAREPDRSQIMPRAGSSTSSCPWCPLAPLGGRLDSGVRQDAPGRAPSKFVTEAPQSAADSGVPPARILYGRPDHEPRQRHLGEPTEVPTMAPARDPRTTRPARCDAPSVSSTRHRVKAARSASCSELNLSRAPGARAPFSADPPARLRARASAVRLRDAVWSAPAVVGVLRQVREGSPHPQAPFSDSPPPPSARPR